MSGQSRSGGGGGMQKSGYDGSQLRVGALVMVVTRRRVVVVAGLGRRVVVVALTVVVVSGSVVVGGSVVVVVLAGTIEVTVIVRGSCSAPAPPAAAPATNPTTPQIRPAAQGRRHHGSWLGGRGGRGGGGGGAPQPAGGPCWGGCPQPPPGGGIGSVGRSAMACPLSLVVARRDSTMPQGRQDPLTAQMCLDLPNHPELPRRWGASLAGKFLQRLAHRVCRLVTAGSGALADRAAFQGDDPAVEAGPVGVDSDGVAAVAGRPEFVPAVVLALVLHLGHGGDRIVWPQPFDARRLEAKADRRWGRRGAARQRST